MRKSHERTRRRGATIVVALIWLAAAVRVSAHEVAGGICVLTVQEAVTDASRAAEVIADDLAPTAFQSADPTGAFLERRDQGTSLWERESPTGVVQGLAGIATRMAVSPTGQVAVAAFGDTIVLWDSGNGRELARLIGQAARVSSFGFAGDELLATADTAGHVVIWDLRLCVPLRRWALLPRRPVLASTGFSLARTLASSAIGVPPSFP